MKRKIEYIVIHCSASDNPLQDVDMVRGWQKDPRFNGGSPLLDIAYHYFIKVDGTIQRGRPEEMPGAGQPGFNRNGIHLCVAGLHKFNGKQMNSLGNLIRVLKPRFPTAKIVGHSEISDKGKQCPVFGIGWLKQLWSTLPSTVE